MGIDLGIANRLRQLLLHRRVGDVLQIHRRTVEMVGGNRHMFLQVRFPESMRSHQRLAQLVSTISQLIYRTICCDLTAATKRPNGKPVGEYAAPDCSAKMRPGIVPRDVLLIDPVEKPEVILSDHMESHAKTAKSHGYDPSGR